jgi:hypothetical protein
VTQTRRLLLTREYLADIFHAADGRGSERTFDWVMHGLGRLYPTNPGAYRQTGALVANHWWVHHERGRTVDGTWQVDWIQRSAGINPALQYGREWFDHEVGVRMTMLGVPGTGAYIGDGPPHQRAALRLHRRQPRGDLADGRRPAPGPDRDLRSRTRAL